MSSLIALNQVAFGYSGNDHFVFEKQFINIQRGVFRAILGTNGSGKTTFAQLLCGLLKPTQGEVQFGGVDKLYTTKEQPKPRVGFVF